MKFLRIASLIVVTMALGACGTRSTARVTPPATGAVAAAAPKNAAQIIVVEGADITNRPYQSLGDIKVTVSKWTVFDEDPTREQVEQALKEKAASMGADAVVFAQFGKSGISMTSWGARDGNGRAVVFK